MPYSRFGWDGAQTPIQTVTQGANAATMTVSGLSCDSRRYRFECALEANPNVSVSLAVAFNGNVATNNSLIFCYGTGSSNAPLFSYIFGQLKATMHLAAKSGKYRYLSTVGIQREDLSPYFSVDHGGAVWTTTAGEVTSITFTISTGDILSGSTIQVFDDGPAQ